MIGKRFEDIEFSDVEELIANKVRESRKIEYKETLPDGKDEAKKEFLADVSSFANSAGGDIFYGIKDEDGVPTKIVGLNKLDSGGIEGEKLRLENIIRSGLNPRIPDVRIKEIVSKSRKSVTVFMIHVPQSWAGPHMVVFGGSMKFHARGDAQKFGMDTEQLRTAFLLSADFPARAREWRNERIAKITGGDAPVSIAAAAKMVLHLVPWDSFNNPYQISARELENKPQSFPTLGGMASSWRINLDGFLTQRGEGSIRDPADSYCQVFRSGKIESAVDILIRDHPDRKIIASQQYEERLLISTAKYLRELEKLGAQPPILILLSFIGVRGATMALGVRSGAEQPIDRDVLLLPEVLIAEPPKNLPRLMRPIFDAAWNACGVAQSGNYDANDQWVVSKLKDVPMEESP